MIFDVNHDLTPAKQLLDARDKADALWTILAEHAHAALAELIARVKGVR